MQFNRYLKPQIHQIPNHTDSGECEIIQPHLSGAKSPAIFRSNFLRINRLDQAIRTIYNKN